MHEEENISYGTNTLEEQYRDFIPEATKKKTKDQAPKKCNPHALVPIHSSHDPCIVDSGASHHMKTKKDILSLVIACIGPPILVEDDSPVKVTRKGRVELDHGSFENILHVPQLFVNLLSVYQITHSGSGKKVEFTPDSVSMFNMQDNSKIVVREVNNQYWLYSFTKFIEPNSSILLMHVDDSSIL
jgi:hypothetical protein